MQEKKISAEVIIIIVVALIIIGVIIFMNANKPEPLVYGTALAKNDQGNVFIDNYKDYKKFVTKSDLGDTLTIQYKKYSMEETYNEEYFETKKLAIVSVSEDDSKDYFHGIKDVIYNDTKTDATIKYEARAEGYAGSFTRTWVTCMIVELDSTVENVNFVIDNTKPEK